MTISAGVNSNQILRVRDMDLTSPYIFTVNIPIIRRMSAKTEEPISGSEREPFTPGSIGFLML